MPVGPKRSSLSLSKKVAKRAVIRPISQLSSGTGIVGDKRPMAAANNLQRLQWNMANRQTTGDWT
jgi:hypothetical protein